MEKALKRLLVATLVLALAACNTAPPKAQTFNATDVMFAQMMIKHFAPASEMLSIAKSRSSTSDVQMLAAAVEVTQADERKTLLGWLSEWQQPEVSNANPDAHAAHGGLPGTGEAEIKALKDAPSADFDRIFLNLFTAHQHQAVELARMEASAGSYPAAKQLAQRIDQSRRGQIELMLKLLS